MHNVLLKIDIRQSKTFFGHTVVSGTGVLSSRDLMQKVIEETQTAEYLLKPVVSHSQTNLIPFFLRSSFTNQGEGYILKSVPNYFALPPLLNAGNN